MNLHERSSGFRKKCSNATGASSSISGPPRPASSTIAVSNTASRVLSGGVSITRNATSASRQWLYVTTAQFVHVFGSAT